MVIIETNITGSFYVFKTSQIKTTIILIKDLINKSFYKYKRQKKCIEKNIGYVRKIVYILL